MVIFDLDGTLLTSEFQLLEETIKDVEAIRSLGLRISIATGRSYKSAKPFLDRLQIVEPMVFSNGAVFDNPETGEREVISGIPLESALIVLMIQSEFKVSIKIHMADGRLFKTDDTPWPGEGIHFEAGEQVPDLQEHLDEDPIKMVFHGENGEMVRFQQRIEEILGPKSQVRLFRSQPNHMEMSNRNVSKGDAVKKLVEKLGIHKSEIITVGDQENDFEMIRDFGLGVMVGSHEPKLEKVCKFKIASPEEKGIATLHNHLKSLISQP